MAWRIAMITDSLPPDTEWEPDEDPTPHDLHDGYEPPETPVPAGDLATVPAEPAPDEVDEFDDPRYNLAYLAMVREAILATPPEPTDADIERMMRHADAWRDCPATRERLVHINEMAADFYERCYPDSWARGYLHERFGDVDDQLAAFRPGYAPDAWTSLTNHLHHHGVTDEELLAAGLSTTARTGRLIDRFRDRVVFPIVHEGEVLGFVGRRNPTQDNDKQIPYLNTPETPLFHKGDQLYTSTHGITDGMTPVIVEGPMDTIAVSLCGDPSKTGAAPLGTALTEQHVRQLHDHGINPIIATDNDRAGQAAADGAYWRLTRHGLHPLRAAFPPGVDPAGSRPADLLRALSTARPLADALLEELEGRAPQCDVLARAVRIIGAMPSDQWEPRIQALADRLAVPHYLARHLLARVVTAWHAQPGDPAWSGRTGGLGGPSEAPPKKPMTSPLSTPGPAQVVVRTQHRRR
jgi:hypothetical protein